MNDRFGDLHKIRAFIAVPVSDEARQMVGEVETDLRSAGAAVKWVEPRNVHMTLKFLGDTKTRQLDDLVAAIRESLAGAASFDLELAGIGTFPPGTRNLRVIWIGTGEGREPLADLARRVEDACARVGFAKEARAFSPHLTIGRVRPGSGSLDRLAAAVAEARFNPLKVAVQRVNLTRSELSPKGPTYTVLESFALEHS
ncbi:MAG: RNA 2',3'-cyclic phosphodiesterase [bacterium]